jgi:glycosyltransferase involved in cell wall biosynthesis/peptidoglycan/xylan/chitin deacetylase (PgdA/CDA1 family)
VTELSVVIPTYNRAGRLRACLDALARQTAGPGVFEVIVVDDGSTDGTPEMVEDLEFPHPLRVLRCEHVGGGPARNTGLREAASPLCLNLDDDIIADEGLVAAHLAAQREHGGIAAIGRIERVLPRRAGRWARHRADELRGHFDRLARGERPLTFTDCYSGNLSVPRDDILAVGGFSSLREHYDIELGFRLARHGLRFVHVEAAHATEDHREGFRDLVDDAESRGRVSLALYESHPSILPWLELGGRGELGGRRPLALRRVLLGLRVPPRLLGAAGVLFRGDRAGTWYRFLRSFCYWRGVRQAVPGRDMWRRLNRGALILLYHSVGAPGEPALRYVVPARRFARQMRWLKSRSYSIISLDELLRLRREYRLPPPRTVVVTLDDGYVDNAEVAAPVLQRLGMPATVFLVTGKAINDWSDGNGDPLARRRLLTPADAARLLGGPLRFGAHTRSHAMLTELDPQDVEAEVVGSGSDLEQALAAPVESFAYPYGRYDETVRERVASAGYLGACSTEAGHNRPARDDYALRRVEIFGHDSLLRFALTVWLGSAEFPFWRRRR